MCFDTAFHHDMPRMAQIVPIPGGSRPPGSGVWLPRPVLRISDGGTETGRRRLRKREAGSSCAPGAGASLAAVQAGLSIDTTMGFTPAAGLVMGMRTGDLDPGVVRFLSQAEGMTADEFDSLVNDESRACSALQKSSDARDLLARQNVDVRAAEAIELFCYQVKKWVGAIPAALAESTRWYSPEGSVSMRRRFAGGFCAGLGFLGIALDE